MKTDRARYASASSYYRPCGFLATLGVIGLVGVLAAPTGAAAAMFDAPLPERPRNHHELAFGPRGLGGLREFVAGHARLAGVAANRIGDVVQAASEVMVITTNAEPKANGSRGLTL